MAASHHIIDRDAFGHWLSGFVDGEGCFRLTFHVDRKAKRTVCNCSFTLSLRRDDIATLEMIKSYLRVGHIYSRPTYRSNKYGNISQPQAVYLVQAINELSDVVVPQFERYGLRAKKARDFVIWKEAVNFCMSIKNRKREGRLGGGIKAHWSVLEIERFQNLCQELQALRQYEIDGLEIQRSSKPSSIHPKYRIRHLFE